MVAQDETHVISEGSVMTEVTLNGHVEVPADRIDDIRTALIDHIALSRAEAGCISFEVTEDPKIAGRFNVAERFSDAAAFEAHQVRVKASDWGQISAGLRRDYVIDGLRKTG